MNSYYIADLHNDLLSFLVDHPSWSIQDPKSRSSYLQMRQGNIGFQALTVFSPTNSSAYQYGQKQLFALDNLLISHADKYRLWDTDAPMTESCDKPISIALVFENAHSLCEEKDSVESALLQLDSLQKKYSHIFYISLTWDLENRFGGGCGSNIGLKDDGKVLLEYLDQKKIAIDLSHASDPLIEDILNFLDKRSLNIPLIASHSNMRSIAPLERNLPDVFIKELIARKGLIGFNFFSPFIGSNVEKIYDHVEHLFSLGGKDALCLGSDFFHIASFPYLKKKYGITEGFFPKFSDASCYPVFLAFLRTKNLFSEEFLRKIAHQNFKDFVERTFHSLVVN